ncbi:MAG: hypothetical protein HKN84_11355, partial [Gammaproteobacteria bacterium]|nr:hypothetical protein [Gammaproteobacteria bacterium]
MNECKRITGATRRSEDINKSYTRQPSVLRLARLLCIGLVAASIPAYAQQLPNPERFEDAIRRFEAEDRRNPPPENAIVLT